jgi:hypothetical protein
MDASGAAGRVGEPGMARCLSVLVVRSHAALIAVSYLRDQIVKTGALIQCRVSVGGAPSNLRIVSGGIRSLPAISSGASARGRSRGASSGRCARFCSRPQWSRLINCLPSSFPHRSCKYDLTRREQQASRPPRAGRRGEVNAVFWLTANRLPPAARREMIPWTRDSGGSDGRLVSFFSAAAPRRPT